MNPARASAARRRSRGGRSAHPVWIAILIALVVIEGALILADRGLLGSVRWRAIAYQNGAFWVGLLFGWAPNYPQQPAVMFVTYAFLHANLGHLLGNAAALVWLGRTLGGRCGPGRFALIYFMVVIGGGVGFALLARQTAPMVGASGAVMGLVGVWIVWDARQMRCAGRGRTAVAVEIGLRTALILAANVASFFALDGVLAWETHLGGFVAGIAVALAVAPSAPCAGPDGMRAEPRHGTPPS